MYFDSGAKTYFRSGGTSTSPLLDGFIFRNGQAGTDLLNIDGLGNSTQLETLLVKGITCMSTLNVSGITTLNNNTNINGITNIHGGSPYAVSNNFMQKGSLTIGDQLLNYGGGNNWSTNTSGLLFRMLK
jgi:hypothetical protein